eukprot:TRINITY_DN144_c0_g1_i1.p1 TRINITY_DN144_c0_g1~~TRINITY_DN144_c0_g1_i1.p1  ORF type:complete len:1349 (-),score=393.80 TRINITY_DN144_c0_g1_i1:30-4076(-)
MHSKLVFVALVAFLVTVQAAHVDVASPDAKFDCTADFTKDTTLKTCTAKCKPFYEKQYTTYEKCYKCCATHDREKPLCPEHDGKVCNGKSGFCDSDTGKCRCFGGFSGRACQIRPVNCPEHDGKICGGNGDCSADFTGCVCHRGYSGKACQYRASGAVLITSDFCDSYTRGAGQFRRLVDYALAHSYIRPKGEKRVVATLPSVRTGYSLSDPSDNNCDSKAAKNYIISAAKRVETIWRLTDSALRNVDTLWLVQERFSAVLSPAETMALGNFVRRGGSILAFFGHEAGFNPDFDLWAREAFGVQMEESAECRASGKVKPTSSCPKDLAVPFNWARNCHESMRILGGSKAKVIMKGTATSNSVHHGGWGKGDSVETVLVPGGALEDCPTAGKNDVPCNGRGYCSGDGVCRCIDGWGGTACTNPPKCPYNAKGTCGGNGVCDSSAKKCKCDPGWTGDMCEDKVGKNGAITFVSDYCNSYNRGGPHFERVMNYVFSSVDIPMKEKPVVVEIGKKRNGYSFQAPYGRDSGCPDTGAKNWIKKRAAKVISIDEVTRENLRGAHVLYIVQDAQSINGHNGLVPSFTEDEAEAIFEFAQRGGAIASFFGHEASKADPDFGMWAKLFGVSLNEAGKCLGQGIAEVNYKMNPRVAKPLQVPVHWTSNCHEDVHVLDKSYAMTVLSHKHGGELAVVPPHSMPLVGAPHKIIRTSCPAATCIDRVNNLGIKISHVTNEHGNKITNAHSGQKVRIHITKPPHMIHFSLIHDGKCMGKFADSGGSFPWTIPEVDQYHVGKLGIELTDKCSASFSSFDFQLSPKYEAHFGEQKPATAVAHKISQGVVNTLNAKEWTVTADVTTPAVDTKPGWQAIFGPIGQLFFGSPVTDGKNNLARSRWNLGRQGSPHPTVYDWKNENMYLKPATRTQIVLHRIGDIIEVYINGVLSGIARPERDFTYSGTTLCIGGGFCDSSNHGRELWTGQVHAVNIFKGRKIVPPAPVCSSKCAAKGFIYTGAPGPDDLEILKVTNKHGDPVTSAVSGEELTITFDQPAHEIHLATAVGNECFNPGHAGLQDSKFQSAISTKTNTYKWTVPKNLGEPITGPIGFVTTDCKYAKSAFDFTIRAPRAHSCAELKKLNPGAGDGEFDLWTLDNRSTFKAKCDMSSDGGGWTLVSTNNGQSSKYLYGSSMKEYIAKNIDNLVVRTSVATKSRTYKRFTKNEGVRGNDHFGNSAWYAVCKQKWADKWGTTKDWGLNKDLSTTVATTHKAAQKQPKTAWKYNMVDACARSLTASDGSTFVAQTGTYYGGWQAHCGALVANPKTFPYAAGCAVNHHFAKTGPEGESTARYSSRMKDVVSIEFWIR